MKVQQKKHPREFTVPGVNSLTLRDCGSISLADDELVSFKTASGKSYDVGAKNWGFYATPSVNKRLLDEGFKTALVKNNLSRYYVMLVEMDMMKEFKDYLLSSGQEVVEWLDERG